MNANEINQIRNKLKQTKPKLEWHGDENISLKSQGMCHYYEIYPNVSQMFALDDGMGFSQHDTLEDAKEAAEHHHWNLLCTELGLK